MTQRQKSMIFSWAVLVVVAFSLSLVWSVIAYAQDEPPGEEGPGTVCVLQLFATGEVMATVVDDTEDIDVAVVVPRDNVTNLPIRCMDLDRLGVAVANQEPFKVTLNTIIFNNKGEVKCTKGPFNLQVNGGKGVSFKGCL
jgi:hypothetical protein